MLEAIARGKASMARLMGGAGRQPREDMVTSALFGPLRMMTPPERARALSVLLDVGLGDATTVEVKLWWPAERGRQADVLIEAKRRGNAIRVLVEVKWGAPLSENQLVNYVELVRKRRGCPPDHVVLLGFAPHHEGMDREEEARVHRRPPRLAGGRLRAEARGRARGRRRGLGRSGRPLPPVHREGSPLRGLRGAGNAGPRSGGDPVPPRRGAALVRAPARTAHGGLVRVPEGEEAMSDEDLVGPEAIGRALWQSARNIRKSAPELDALLRELGELLTEEEHEGVDFVLSGNEHDQDGWLLWSYADVYTVKQRVEGRRGARRRLGQVTVCARLHASSEEEGEGWEGAHLSKLFVGYQVAPDYAWAIEYFDLHGDGTADHLTPDGGHLWRYREEGKVWKGSWFFCLPLAALRDREALRTQVVKPLLALIGDGDGLGDPDGAFPADALACRARGPGSGAG